MVTLYWVFVQFMYAAVYRLREHGNRLPKPKDPVKGELRLHPHHVGTNDRQALLAELVREETVGSPCRRCTGPPCVTSRKVAW